MANQDWWKDVPCHFMWKLEDKTEKNFRSVQNMLESKHEDCTISKVKTHPPFLLFRAYLHSSRFHEVVNNYEKALSLLDEAEKFIQETEEPDEREIYLLISTANRVWILNNLGREAEKTKTLRILEEMWAKIPQKEKFNALVNVTKAFALARLGPTKYEESERCYREAIEVYPNKSRWLHDLGKLVGRQTRQIKGEEERKDQRLQEEIDLYRKAQRCRDPRDESIQVWLAMALYNSGKSLQEAKSMFQSTSQTTSPVVNKKAQYLRREGRIEEAIDLLETALHQLRQPRAVLYAQLAYVYGPKETNLGVKKKKLELFQKCIELEPSLYFVAQERAALLGDLGRHEEAEEAFQAIIDCPLILCKEKEEAIAEREKYRAGRNRANAQ